MSLLSEPTIGAPDPDVVVSLDPDDVRLLLEVLGVAVLAARETQNVPLTERLVALATKFGLLRQDMEGVTDDAC